MHLFSASTSNAVSSPIDLDNSLLENCNSLRSADKYARRKSLERYDVKSCGESFIVPELSLVRSRGVFTPLLFAWSASISIRSGAFPNGGTTYRITRFRNRASHASKSFRRGPNVAMCFTSKCFRKSSLNSAI